MTTDLAIDSTNFATEVLQSDVPVLIDFWAEWCGPCKAIGPSIEQIAQEYAGRAKVFKVNVDTEGELSSKYGIMSIPALLIFKNGQVVDQFVGAAPKATLASFLERNL